MRFRPFRLGLTVRFEAGWLAWGRNNFSRATAKEFMLPQPRHPPFRSSSPRRSICRGFTLIELLVVICTVGVLVALLLPGIQRVRESARRTTCASNLHQIGLGLNNYVSRNRSFPTGCVDCQWWNPERKQHSWITSVLLDLENEHLVADYKMQSPYNSEANRLVAAHVLLVFLCPSTETTNRKGLTTGDVNGNGNWDPGDDLAYTDYGGIYGIEGPPYEPPQGSKHFVADHAIGVMVHEIPTTLRAIRDGLSATALVGECTGRGGGLTEQSEWANGQNVFAQYYTNPINTTQNNELWSDHPGGGNLLFCDGHVKFFTEETDQSALNGVLTRAGRDHVSL